MHKPNRKVQLKTWTEDFGSKEDEEQYIQWLDSVRKKLEPQPYHNSVEEIADD